MYHSFWLKLLMTHTNRLFSPNNFEIQKPPTNQWEDTIRRIDHRQRATSIILQIWISICMMPSQNTHASLGAKKSRRGLTTVVVVVYLPIVDPHHTQCCAATFFSPPIHFVLYSLQFSSPTKIIDFFFCEQARCRWSCRNPKNNNSIIIHQNDSIIDPHITRVCVCHDWN